MTDGWQEVPLGKVLKRADRFEKKDELQTYRFAGTYSFARGIFAGETKEGSTFRLDKIQRIKKGDFIYCKIMAWEGAFGIAPEKVDDCVMSGAFVAYEVDQTQIDPKFLDYYFKQEPVWKTIGSQSTGTNVRRRSLHPDQFEKATVPLPPLPEQRRIVAHIESLASRVNEAQRMREEAYKETDLLFSKATKEIFVKHLENVTKIGDEFRVTTGGTPSRSNPSYWEGDVRWVSSGEVAFNRIFDTREKITEHGVSESNAKVYPPKTVLIAMIGQGKTRGQCAILECHAATNQNVAGIHVYETNHLPEYVYWWLRSRYLESRVSEIGTAQPALSGERVKQMPIPLPPLDEQRRIVAYLGRFQARLASLRQLQAETKEELDALLPSVLDRAFKGEL